MNKTYKREQAQRMFQKLQVSKSRSNHHIRGFVISDSGEKLYPPIYFNKSMKDIPPRIAKKLQKNLKLDADKFDDLISCHMSRADYLIERGLK